MITINKKLKEALLAGAESLGWSFAIDSCDKSIEFRQSTPAGEAFKFKVKGKDLVQETLQVAANFDVDDHVKMWLDARASGTAGVPGAQELVDDACAIQDMLKSLANAMEKSASDYDNFISGKMLAELMRSFEQPYTPGFAKLYDQLRKTPMVRRKKTGKGHATRWWFHRWDVMEFCQRWKIHRDENGESLSLPKLKALYLIMGPSGSGKTSIVSRLKEEYGYMPVKPYTDRPRRSPAEDNYTFVSEDEFHAIKGKEQMVGFGEYDGHQYGATIKQLSCSDLYIVEPDGARDVLARCAADGRRPVHVIGVTAPYHILEERLVNRGDQVQTVRRRLEGDKIRFGSMTEMCEIVVSNVGELGRAVRIIADYIRGSECADAAEMASDG